MTDDEAPAIPCAVCGARLLLQDVVIVSHELLPSWISSDEQPTTAIVHKACELDGDRGDQNWTREFPQTLSHVLAAMASTRDIARRTGPGLNAEAPRSVPNG